MIVREALNDVSESHGAARVMNPPVPLVPVNPPAAAVVLQLRREGVILCLKGKKSVPVECLIPFEQIVNGGINAAVTQIGRASCRERV